MSVKTLLSELPARLLTSSDNPGNERLRRIFLTALASIVSRFGTMLVLLVTVPMALHHLGPERFGIWMILSSLAALVAFADFGIGNGVLNLVATALGEGDTDSIRRTASSALAILSVSGAAIALLSVLGGLTVDWASVLGITSPLARIEAGPSVMIFGLCLAAGIPFSLGTKVQSGLQEGYAVNLWTGLGGLLACIGVVSAIQLGAGTPILVLALFGGQQLAMILNFIYFFYVRRPDLAPKMRFVEYSRVIRLFNLGSSFFLLQAIAVISFRVDAAIISRFFGAADAGIYAIYERLFSLISMVVSVAIMPLWPAYGEAFSRGDHAWTQRIFKKSLLYSVGMTFAASLPLVIFYREIIYLWVGKDLLVSIFLVLGLAVWKLLEAFGVASAMLLNGLGMLRVQVWIAVAMGIASLALKLWLAPHLGIWFMPWATNIGYLLVSVPPLLFLLHRALQGMDSASPQLAK